MMGKVRGAGRRGPAMRPVAVLIVLLACWAGSRSWAVRRDRRALAEAREEMQAGRYGHAARRLQALAAGGPVRDEAAYLLGDCEKARGRDEEAFTAWAQVPIGSPFATRALRRRAEILIQRGRLGDAESLIEGALAEPPIDAGALRILLGMVYSLQGRTEDGERLVEANWRQLDRDGLGASERAIQLARLHAALRREAASVYAMRAYLDRAARLAPEDDRVWLGRAILATRAGAFDEAARWLDACRRRRPDDPAVWRARLDWAVASVRVDEARGAMAHLPAPELPDAQVYRLAAWLAARRGDTEAEGRALERLAEADPADRATLDRLAARARERGEAGRAAEIERRKADIESPLARFQDLDRRNQPIRDAAELARIAEQLGRRFEARAFLTVAVAADPGRADLRESLERLTRSGRGRSSSPADAGRTLAQVLAPEFEAAGH